LVERRELLVSTGLDEVDPLWNLELTALLQVSGISLDQFVCIDVSDSSHLLERRRKLVLVSGSSEADIWKQEMTNAKPVILTFEFVLDT
jgi:hypothetical protein